MKKQKSSKARGIEIKEFILKEASNHSSDLVTFVAKKYKISRVSSFRHVKNLVKEGRLIQVGETKNTQYLLPSKADQILKFKVTSDLSESDIWDKNFSYLKNELKKNVYDICIYGFTEMVNNVIDHSESNNLVITFIRKNKNLSFMIFDDGVGIFNKIKNTYKLKDIKDSILELTKGKVTTDPRRHSGEGLFFTSRAFDEFSLTSSGNTFLRFNPLGDWTIKTKEEKGLKTSTLVVLNINENSNLKIQDIFKNYTDPENLKFNKTEVLVSLSQVSDDLISRSQAKRVLSGLNKFEKVILDFKGVATIGQAFVDEIFRVYQNKYPKIKFEWINANSDIEFMIKRGLKG